MKVIISWLVVLRFNTILTAKVIIMAVADAYRMCFLAFSHQYLNTNFFPNHRLLFSHASVKVRGKNTLERNFTSAGSQTHNHQVMGWTRSVLSHSGRAVIIRDYECYSAKNGGLMQLEKVLTSSRVGTDHG